MTDKTNTNQQQAAVNEHLALGELRMNQDLKNSILIFSILANLFIFTAWIALQVTTQFDSQVMSFLFNR